MYRVLPWRVHQRPLRVGADSLSFRLAQAFTCVMTGSGAMSPADTTRWTWLDLTLTACNCQFLIRQQATRVSRTSFRWASSRTTAESFISVRAITCRFGSSGRYSTCQAPSLRRTHPRVSPGSQVPYVVQVRKYASGGTISSYPSLALGASTGTRRSHGIDPSLALGASMGTRRSHGIDPSLAFGASTGTRRSHGIDPSLALGASMGTRRSHGIDPSLALGASMGTRRSHGIDPSPRRGLCFASTCARG